MPNTNFDAKLDLVRVLSESSSVRVELAFWNGRQVIRKRLISSAPFMCSRFAREGEISQRLEHPNIVSCLGAWEGGLLYEYLEGTSLREYINLHGTVPESVALEMVRGILSGVAYAHVRGIYHLDLKPDNVMRLSCGRVKVIDFGLAKDISLKEITREGDRLGTPHYMAPEQFQGERCEPRSDLFSVAAILFELVMGKPPFPNPFAWMYGKALLGPINAHPALEHFIRWGLMQDPSLRPDTALEYLVALERVMEMLGLDGVDHTYKLRPTSSQDTAGFV